MGPSAQGGFGLDAGTAAACHRRVEEDCNFGAVLDGSDPRLTS
ncbi:hypothetical protein [Actinomyces wuliandei]|nr:hypothetical protein [Actinomyces wuliandei]